MGAITDLWKSERGLLALGLLIAVSVLLGIGSITYEQWDSTIKWVFGIYVTGKTITSAIETVKGSPSSPSDTGKTLNPSPPSPTSEEK